MGAPIMQTAPVISPMAGSANPHAASVPLQVGAPWAPQLQSQPVATKIDINVQQCIGNNIPLFQSAWSPVWKFLQDSAKADASEAIPDMSALLVSMMDVQLALRACGVTPVQEAMLFDAMHSGNVASSIEMGSGARAGQSPSMVVANRKAEI